MITLFDTEERMRREQDAIIAQLQELFGDDQDFQARLDALKDQDENIDVAKANHLVYELTTGKSRSLGLQRQSTRGAAQG
jgi:hypothetical protein